MEMIRENRRNPHDSTGFRENRRPPMDGKPPFHDRDSSRMRDGHGPDRSKDNKEKVVK